MLIPQNSDSTVTSYLVRYDRIDPEWDEHLTSGNEKITYSNKNEIILKEMAVGGTFRIEVKVKTTDGSSAYLVPTIASALMLKTEQGKKNNEMFIYQLHLQIFALRL